MNIEHEIREKKQQTRRILAFDGPIPLFSQVLCIRIRSFRRRRRFAIDADTPLLQPVLLRDMEIFSLQVQQISTRIRNPTRPTRTFNYTLPFKSSGLGNAMILARPQIGALMRVSPKTS